MSDIDPIRQALRSSAYDDALAEHLGLNPTDLRCLELVVTAPGATAGGLMTGSGLTSGAITGVLDRLERAGLVERRPDASDRRSVTVWPVEARASELVAPLGELDGALDRLLGSRSEAERGAIRGFVTDAARLVAAEATRLRAGVRGGFVGDTFGAPLGEVARGRLVFVSGAPRLSMNIAPLGPSASARVIMETSSTRLDLTAGAPDGQLIRATFDGPTPEVRVAAGVATVRYRRAARAAFSSRRARIALNPTIPWDIEIHGGITDLSGRLSGVRLASLELGGGANHLELELREPVGTVGIRVAGVVSRARVRRPTGVPAAIRVAGGVSHLRLDGRRLGQVGGERRFESSGYAAAPDRYEIELLGGAADVRVDA
jgi:DNA-binding MarR family transcriptional regulator